MLNWVSRAEKPKSNINVKACLKDPFTEEKKPTTFPNLSYKQSHLHLN